METTLKDAAFKYTALHKLAITPLAQKTKYPAHLNWTNDPINGYTTNPDKARKWWTSENPNYNIGIVTGAPSGGLIVLDLDNHADKGKNGSANLEAWERAHGVTLPETVTALSGSGGVHLYYRDPDHTYQNIADKGNDPAFSGIDIRANGGQVVAPPSIHPNGGRYEWKAGASPDDIQIAQVNETVKQFMDDIYKANNASCVKKTPDTTKTAKETPDTAKKTPDRQNTPGDEIPEGCRTQTLVSMIGAMIRAGFSDEEIRAAITVANDNRCDPPLTDKELEGQVFPALYRGWERGTISLADRSTPPEHTTEQPDELTDFHETIYTNCYKPIKTGIGPLDRKLGGGLRSQTIVFLGAEPGAGKTTLATQIFESMAKQGQPGLYFNLEMSRNQMFARSMAHIVHEIDPGHNITALDVLQAYACSETTQDLINQAVDRYRATIYPFLKYNPGNVGSNVTDILNFIDKTGKEATAAGKPAPNICIDYLQIMTGDKYDDETRTIKKAVDGLKSYAKTYDAIVFCIMAQSRKVNSSGAATQQAGRDTSAIEYGADTQLQLVRDAAETNRMKLFVTKSRWGALDLTEGLEMILHGGQNYFEYTDGAFKYNGTAVPKCIARL